MKQSREFNLILTATINPTSVAMLAVRDQQVRRQQYAQALGKWLNLDFNELKRIVFIENSGAGLDDLKQIADKSNPHGRRVDFVEMTARQDPTNLGKGYGEFQMIDRVMDDPLLTSPDAIVGKVTGRLFVPNLPSVFRGLPDCFEIAADCLMLDVPFLDTRLAFWTAVGYRTHLAGLYKMMNDSTGDIAETVLGREIMAKKSSVKLLDLLPREPLWDGISGTHGVSYGSLIRRLKRPYLVLRRIARRTVGRRGGANF